MLLCKCLLKYKPNKWLHFYVELTFNYARKQQQIRKMFFWNLNIIWKTNKNVQFLDYFYATEKDSKDDRQQVNLWLTKLPLNTLIHFINFESQADVQWQYWSKKSW